MKYKYMSEITRNRQQSTDNFIFLDMKEENEHELQQIFASETCPCLSILSPSAAIDWLKRLCGSIQSCFGHQSYYINVILRNSLYG